MIYFAKKFIETNTTGKQKGVRYLEMLTLGTLKGLGLIKLSAIWRYPLREVSLHAQTF